MQRPDTQPFQALARRAADYGALQWTFIASWQPQHNVLLGGAELQGVKPGNSQSMQLLHDSLQPQPSSYVLTRRRSEARTRPGSRLRHRVAHKKAQRAGPSAHATSWPASQAPAGRQQIPRAAQGRVGGAPSCASCPCPASPLCGTQRLLCCRRIWEALNRTRDTAPLQL
jgi:hypothetical protein